MPKNILIFSDGTGQAGGVRPDQRLSNIYKIYRASRIGPDSKIDPKEQVAFYDAGLGTDDDVGNTIFQFVRFLQKVLASATGRGITRNITDCYESILNSYEPGDRIFLFGFSRGAYTIRSLAGVLALCGVPILGKDGQSLPKYRSETRSIADEAVRKVYEHGAGRVRADFDVQRVEQGRRFRKKYGSETNGHANVAPYFIGVFDTVASLGAKGLLRFGLVLFLLSLDLVACYFPSWLLNKLFNLNTLHLFLSFLLTSFIIFAISSIRSTFKYICNFPNKGDFSWHIAKWEMKNYDRSLDQYVSYARHAISIDEARADFPRVQWGFKNEVNKDENGLERFIQLWFAGNHSDIGGSYPEEESRLSDISLKWMIDEATAITFPIIIDEDKLNHHPSASGMQHCEIDALEDENWFLRLIKRSWKRSTRWDCSGAGHHSSVAERFAEIGVLQKGRLSPYLPKALVNDPRYTQYYHVTEK